MRYIGLLDCNNFFVSCERLFRPDLLGRPVLVLSSNDGCVIARSQEVKDMGVAMGVPHFQIKELIKEKQITTFSSHLALYRDISERVFTVLQDLVNSTDIYSIDEAFFQITAANETDALQQIEDIKRQVETWVGIPVSIGLAATKTQAKYVSRLAKGSIGTRVVGKREWEELVSTIPIGDIWGVGGQLLRRYQAADMHTVADLLAASSVRLQAVAGITGLRLQAELSGYPVALIEVGKEPVQSIMKSRSFAQSTHDIAVVKDALAYHIRHVAARLRASELVTGRLLVQVRPSRFGDFARHGIQKEILLTSPTNDTVELLQAVMAVVDELFDGSIPYHKAGIHCSQLRPVVYLNNQLFPTASDSLNSSVMSVIDAINARYGHSALTVGRQVSIPTWHAKRAQASPAYTTQWTDLATVRAN